jgi:hypothetical protein
VVTGPIVDRGSSPSPTTIRDAISVNATVNRILRTAGCAVSAAVTASGASSGGLSTTVSPAISAGATARNVR